MIVSVTTMMWIKGEHFHSNLLEEFKEGMWTIKYEEVFIQNCYGDKEQILKAIQFFYKPC